MIPCIDYLKKLFRQAELAAFSELTETFADIVPSSQEKFGHYQYNSAMRLAKILKKTPREVAVAVTSKIEDPQIAKLEIAGPGFVNITLSAKTLEKLLWQIYHSPHLAVPLANPKKRVILDFSSPNTAKEMHVGHLRSTILGDALARHFEFLGHDVKRLNHIGDWGTAFGMLIAYMQEEVPEVLSGKEKTDLSHLVNWYRASKKKFDEDPEFKKRSQLQVVALQGGDTHALQAWKIICAISKESYDEIYKLLDIQIEERGESFYNPLLADVIRELEEKKLVTVSEGAKCIFLEGFQNREGEPLPLMVQKSDGGYNYDTTDMAAIRYRLLEEKGDRLIYVTDAGQHQHFMMIFQAAQLAGWLKNQQVEHVSFGLVLGTDGKKFKTRSGDTERLIDLIQQAIIKAKVILKEKNPDYSEELANSLAEAIGIGAIKYADLSTNRTGDYLFSYDKMLRFEGNTAAYLMYSYVRINGLKRNSSFDTAKLSKLTLEHPTELALAIHLIQFSEAISRVVDELMPNRMADYLYGLAEKFHAFFQDCRVVGNEYEESRLLLAEITARTMQTGLQLLGLKAVSRM